MACVYANPSPHPKTIFCDIDGTLLQHLGDVMTNRTSPQPPLPAVIDTFRAWDKAGHHIVLTTARKASERARTEEQLRAIGAVYDDLLMGLPPGPRVLINDRKPADGAPDTAYAINLLRNEGLTHVNVDSQHVVIPDEYVLGRDRRRYADWGSLERVEVNGRYAVFRRSLQLDWSTPVLIHPHRRKTLVVLEGLLRIHLPAQNEDVVLEPGQSQTLPSATPHFLQGLSEEMDTIVLEVSGHEIWDTQEVDVE